MGRRIVSGGCHLAERKNGDFVALRRLSPDGEELDGGGRMSGSFILRSAQQEGLFIASGTLSRGGDSSPGGSWPPVTWKGSGTHMPLSPLRAATPRLSFRPACGPGWPVLSFINKILFINRP
ncbi:unnamed protein product [Spirodela intermedia]|uniref:Uncharacterized protein n=1 Tax=Spirodela intermedia TaxID=51605 RepID=A0ABN7E9Q7_SPIIN|nr:unnamed protein product [Spirodela intermedia]